MSMRRFIREHKDELREMIRKAHKHVGSLSQEDLRLWILNDEGLYDWARSEGVPV